MCRCMHAWLCACLCVNDTERESWYRTEYRRLEERDYIETQGEPNAEPCSSPYNPENANLIVACVRVCVCVCVCMGVKRRLYTF